MVKRSAAWDARGATKTLKRLFTCSGPERVLGRLRQGQVQQRLEHQGHQVPW